MEAYTQKCKLSATSKAISIFCAALIIGIGACICLADKTVGLITLVSLGLTLVGITVAGLYAMPTYLSVDDDALTVCFPLRTRSFPLAEIAEATVYDKPKTFIRVCGSGGYLGYWGWFSNRELGRFYMYASNLGGLLLVRLKDGRKYVVSASDPAAMVAEINRRLKH